ncbi:hypothetical protein D082_60340 (plasmid) [Synechocystis sp. PCC 6714]|nr:hypothetical protein D082_60340 [Synechocystis sp. PCC 6714]
MPAVTIGAIAVMPSTAKARLESILYFIIAMSVIEWGYFICPPLFVKALFVTDLWLFFLLYFLHQFRLGRL